MKTQQFRLTTLAGAIVLSVFSQLASAQVSSGSTGADGAFAPQVNTTVQVPPSGVFNYTTVTIPSGVTVTYTPNATNTPITMLATGQVDIEGSLVIDGANSAPTGNAGAGVLGTDGVAGAGGPGGYAGGVGGPADPNNNPANQAGGAGLGPGGAPPCTSANSMYCTNSLSADAGYATAGNQNYISAGAAYGSPTLQPLIGGSGGAGGAGGAVFSGSGGGGGGGAILIASSANVILNGIVSSQGGWGGQTGGQGLGAPGGGGSGGGIRIVANSISGGGYLWATGGCSANGGPPPAPGSQPTGSNCAGNARGSAGFIRLEAADFQFGGSANPTYSVASPQPVMLSSVPTLVIQSINGVNVPAAPTGNGDVTLPGSVANTLVPVILATTNIPVGNTVQLTISPQYGASTTITSPALAGTTASAQTTVSATLPSGPCTLMATTTYTIVVAMGDALAPYANDERVGAVKLASALGGKDTTYTLVTVSGKEFPVTASALRKAGFAG